MELAGGVRETGAALSTAFSNWGGRSIDARTMWIIALALVRQNRWGRSCGSDHQYLVHWVVVGLSLCMGTRVCPFLGEEEKNMMPMMRWCRRIGDGHIRRTQHTKVWSPLLFFNQHLNSPRLQSTVGAVIGILPAINASSSRSVGWLASPSYRGLSVWFYHCINSSGYNSWPNPQPLSWLDYLAFWVVSSVLLSFSLSLMLDFVHSPSPPSASRQLIGHEFNAIRLTTICSTQFNSALFKYNRALLIASYTKSPTWQSAAFMMGCILQATSRGTGWCRHRGQFWCLWCWHWHIMLIQYCSAG